MNDKRNVPGFSLFFPLGVEVVEPEEVVDTSCSCLEIVATALKNKGEAIVIPGTSEYGRIRTLEGRTWTGVSKTYVRRFRTKKNVRLTGVDVHHKHRGSRFGFLDGYKHLERSK